MEKLQSNDWFAIQTIAQMYYPIEWWRKHNAYRVFIPGSYNIYRNDKWLVIIEKNNVRKCKDYLELAETLKQFFILEQNA